MLFRYVGDEPDRLYPSLPTRLDGDGQPLEVIPATVNNGDVLDLAADPGDGRWVRVTGKAAQTAVLHLADNDPAREQEDEEPAAADPPAADPPAADPPAGDPPPADVEPSVADANPDVTKEL